MIEKKGVGIAKKKKRCDIFDTESCARGGGWDRGCRGGMWIWRERRGKRDERIGGRGGQEEVERIDEEGFGRKI